MWEADSSVLPVALNSHAAVDALGDGLVLDDFDLDNNFVGWRREARIDWPDRRQGLILRAGAPLDFSWYSALQIRAIFAPSPSAMRPTG
ncbi:hypothetical protein [Robbsia sp. KACC 23696]|uniref:hypothetical protein n=1 Tax=Robbsia sp. KACC 23696 TaxID=3149231 RepID=UPI00325B64A7